jgi:ubiquinone/menaquinone biosynthesis C-methylase UbiE
MPTASASNSQNYLPAAGHDIFLPLYDFVAKLLGADHARDKLLAEARLQPGNKVLDIGCGTGTFATILKGRFPAIEVVGLDPDPKALARARRKAEKADVAVRFDQGFANDLQYPSASFDAVFSSFMFHHLEPDTREKALREVRRVLKPAGNFFLLDFELSEQSRQRAICIFHSTGHLRDNTEPRILGFLNAAGFSSPRKFATHPVFFGFGKAGLYRASPGHSER